MFESVSLLNSHTNNTPLLYNKSEHSIPEPITNEYALILVCESWYLDPLPCLN